MTIINILFVCCMALNSYTAYAMNEKTELITAHNHNRFHIKTIQDLPKLSFENMRHITNKPLSLSKSFTFDIATLLPQELTYKIITLMLDNDPVSAELFYVTPVWYAFKRYDDARKMIQESEYTIEQPINNFFRLSVKKQQKILRLALFPLELAKANSMVVYDIGNFTQEQERQRKCAFYKLLAKASMVGFTVGGTVFLIPFLTVHTKNCSRTNTANCFSDINPILTSIAGGLSAVTGTFCGIFYYILFKLCENI